MRELILFQHFISATQLLFPLALSELKPSAGAHHTFRCVKNWYNTNHHSFLSWDHIHDSISTLELSGTCQLSIGKIIQHHLLDTGRISSFKTFLKELYTFFKQVDDWHLSWLAPKNRHFKTSNTIVKIVDVSLERFVNRIFSSRESWGRSAGSVGLSGASISYGASHCDHE